MKPAKRIKHECQQCGKLFQGDWSWWCSDACCERYWKAYRKPQ